MTDAKVIDLTAARQRRSPELVVPVASIPSMTVHYYAGTEMLLRVIGVPNEPDAMRSAAGDMINGAMALLAQAHRLDGVDNQHVRMLATLYASGRVHLATYNTPGETGLETTETLAWMRDHLPHLADLLTQMIHKEKP